MNIHELDFLSLLARGLRGEVPPSSGSKDKTGDKERKLGLVVKSTRARRLYSLRQYILDEANRLRRCFVISDDEFETLMRRRELVDILFWQTVKEEHFHTAGNSVFLREGWQLVAPIDNWAVIPVEEETKEYLRSFSSQIEGIVLKSNPICIDIDLFPVAHNEEPIGVLVNDSARQLYALKFHIFQDMVNRLPECVVEEDWRVVLLSEDEKQQYQHTIAEYRQITAITHNFFLEVFSEFITENTHCNIDIRENWQIVRLREEDQFKPNPINDSYGNFFYQN